MKKPVLIYVALIALIATCTVANAQESNLKPTFINKVKKIFNLKKDSSLNNILKKNEISPLDAFEGVWTSEDTEFVTVFTHNKYTDTMKVYTFSFTHNGLVEEKIIDIKDNIVKTHVTNSLNGWDVKVDYRVINNNVLIANFEGSTDITSMFYRANIQTNHPIIF